MNSSNHSLIFFNPLSKRIILFFFEYEITTKNPYYLIHLIIVSNFKLLIYISYYVNVFFYKKDLNM